MIGSPYMRDMFTTFYRRESKYFLVKGGKAYFLKAHKEREKITPLAVKYG